MSLPINSERAERAREVIVEYHDRHESTDDDLRVALVDLLADLQHFCDDIGIDFEHALEVATEHYNCELGDTD